MACEHDWLPTGSGTHFQDEPNSRIRHKQVRKLTCAWCNQRGFRYLHLSPVTKRPSMVVYTWSPCDAEKEPDQIALAGLSLQQGGNAVGLRGDGDRRSPPLDGD